MRKRLLSFFLAAVLVFSMVAPCYADNVNGGSEDTEEGSHFVGGVAVPKGGDFDPYVYGMRLTSYSVDENGAVIPGTIKHLNVMNSQSWLNRIVVFSRTGHSIMDYCESHRTGVSKMTAAEMGISKGGAAANESNWIAADFDAATREAMGNVIDPTGDYDNVAVPGVTESTESNSFDFLSCLVATSGSKYDKDAWELLMDQLKHFADSNLSSSNATVQALCEFMAGYEREEDVTKSDSSFYMIGEPLVVVGIDIENSPFKGIGCYTLNELYNLTKTDWRDYKISSTKNGEPVQWDIYNGIQSVYAGLASIGFLEVSFSEAYGSSGYPIPAWTDLGNGYRFGEFDSAPPYNGKGQPLMRDITYTSGAGALSNGQGDALRYSGVVDFSHYVNKDSEDLVCSMYYTLEPDGSGGLKLKHLETEVEVAKFTEQPVYMNDPVYYVDAPFVGSYATMSGSTRMSYTTVLNDMVTGPLKEDVVADDLDGTLWNYTTPSQFMLPTSYDQVVDMDYGLSGIFTTPVSAYSCVLGLSYDLSAIAGDVADLATVPSFDIEPSSTFTGNALSVAGMDLFSPWDDWEQAVENYTGNKNLLPRSVWVTPGTMSRALPAIRGGVTDVDMYPFMKVTAADASELTDAPMVYYLRYLCIPQSSQYDYVEVVDAQGNVTDFGFVGTSLLGYDSNSGDLNIQTVSDSDVQALFSNVDLSTLELNDVFSLPFDYTVYASRQEIGAVGSVKTFTGSMSAGYVSPNWPVTGAPHEAACIWRVEENPAPATVNTADVPEWRLSLYKEDVFSGDLRMAMSVVTVGCCGIPAKLTPSGVYDYNLKFPDGAIYTPTQANEHAWRLNSGSTRWIQTRLDSRVTKYPYVNSASAMVHFDADTLYVKATVDSGILAASWRPSVVSRSVLSSDYDISTGDMGAGSSGDYRKDSNLEYQLKTLTVYTNSWRTYIPTRYGHRHGFASKNPFPNDYPGTFSVGASFARYVPTSLGSMSFGTEVSSESTFASLRHSAGTVGIYPEYGLLFDDNENNESIVWAVGDEKRELNSYIWQTLQYKVHVDPTVSGTSVATDTRALARATQLGSAGLPVIYKGAGVGTLYKLTNAAGSTNAALLTVKTYALDFNSSSTYQGLKSTWGNSGYKPENYHSALYTEIKRNNVADVQSKLLVADTSNNLKYTGGTSKGTVKFEPVDYSGNASPALGGTAVCFEHDLIIRNGVLLGVKYCDHSSRVQTTLSMSQLKQKDSALYTALIEMGLYDESNPHGATVLSVLAKDSGDALDESAYIGLLNAARSSVDGASSLNYGSVAPQMGKGWYGEDTTVLSVYEYVSNFTVPSTSISDKLSMTVPGLETPANKQLFFNTLFFGHNYLRYGLDINVSAVSSHLAGNSPLNVFFEYSSLNAGTYAGTGFNTGVRKSRYLVPNVSVTDTTRLS